MATPLSDLVTMMRGFQESRALLSAVELDLFTAVGGGDTAAGVAAKLGTDPRATEMLMNAVVSLGALKKAAGVFHNTPETARFLCDSSPDNQRWAMMHTVNMWTTWNTLTDAVRKGTSVIPPTTEAPDPVRIKAFIAAMHRNASVTAQHMVEVVGASGVKRLLDVGGGSGAYSIAFAAANPALRAEVFDLPTVVGITQEHISAAGLVDRVTTRTGDLRTDDLGSGNDLVLLSAIAHMLSEAENQDLFRRCCAALNPGGRLVIREFILSDDKTAPRPAALFALNMLVATRAGSSYSEAEYRAWLTAAGFTTVTRPEPEGDLLIATR